MRIPRRRLRVALLDSMLPPYRVPLYNELSRFPDISLTVLLSSFREKDRSWRVETEKICFHYRLLHGVNLLVRTQSSRMNLYHIHFNPGIIYQIASRCDCIVLNGCSSMTSQIAFWGAKLIGLPVILWYRSFGSSKSPLRKLVDPILNMNIRLSKALIVPGEKSRDHILSKGTKAEKVYVIGNPVDNDRFASLRTQYSHAGIAKIKEELGINANKVILYVGRLIEAKGVQYLLKAFASIKDLYESVELVIAGDGYFQDQLCSIVRDAHIENVRFAGFADLPDLSKFYFAADLLVLPSLYEPWGLVINEAMNFGLPIVVTETVGAAGELVQHGWNGYIVKPADATSLAVALRKILDDGALARKMGENSTKKISQHTLKHAAYTLHKAILSVADEKGAFSWRSKLSDSSGACSG